VILADAPRRLRVYIRIEPRDVRRLERVTSSLTSGTPIPRFAAQSVRGKPIAPG
jgi:hypothetical protein